MPLSSLEFVLIALAAYRASRALALDSITEPFREWLDFRTSGSRWRKVSELISCGFCNGFWLSGITYFTYVAVTGSVDDVPVLIHLMLWWAVAGAQALLICLDSFLLTVKETID